MTAYSAGYIVGSILGAAFGMGLFIFAIVAIVKAFTRKTTGWIVTACISGLMMLGLLGIAVAGAVAGIAAGVNKAGSASSTRHMVSKDGRYSFDVPSIWREMPQLNAEASLAAGYGLREQYMMLIVDSRQDFSGSLSNFSKLVTERIGQKMKGAVLGEAQSLTVNGYPALRKRISGTTQNINLVYLHTSVELPDSYCQILCWTLGSRESTAFPIYEKVIQTFKAQDSALLNAPLMKSKVKSNATAKTAPVTDRVRDLLVEQLGVDAAQIKPAARLAEDLGADELDLVEIVMAVEEEFDIEINDENAAKMKTVGALVAYVEQLTKTSVPASKGP